MDAIKVQGIGKKYKRGQYAGYLTLRDSLMGLFKRPQTDNPLSKKEFWALQDISFEVKEGEVIGIIGSNGAGKSTLLKILTGITEPTAGTALIKGRVGSLLEVGTGFHPELTGRENIYLNGAILGMPRSEIRRKFDQIVDFAGVEQFIDTPVKRFSSGMQVRLAFAVAAHLEPEILLIDEVLAVGDAAFQKKSLAKMEEVTQKQGRTILFVSHNMEAIQNLCETCVWLDNGQVKMIGQTKQVIEAYLKSSVINQAVKKFSAKQNKEAQINKITVKNATGQVTTVLDFACPFSIEIEYELAKDIPQFFLMLKIGHESVREKYVLIGLSNDNNYPNPTKKGKYKAVVIIPPFLNTGRYNFFVALTTHMIPYLDSSESISITLNQLSSSPYPMIHRNPESQVLIPLKWNITQPF
ncbi:MAG TPA: ABC transporter ATP-binding protein [Candidatus Jacksonbacteria bacterium]|nr:MAG: ABC transporter related protein [Parcubacteria group bacterium GW2011_GWC2_44_22]OGY76444.1 MAG: hypothetical protein A2295_02220 [Candidatus Jacksonbacteria bacterium RIFOXYB2_FULL_44_15]OGY76815.1 MAG: hypothetical protein A2240_04555 [Candidatus Jacksonbacteria bacterium RIFOXYA2_FULL_43_12]OGY82174.1 MAG: hypothetical protein A2550_05725 [Candidatus Jacksonbacteria bacterium RIFOXYD2_FULL_43_21]HBH45843.1 ABC transporter ATP-binding protein [Candidatus Jacksonbacteria bacterium]